METYKLEYLLLVTLCVTLSQNASDANTVLVKTGPEYEKAVTITQASLETVYSNRTDRCNFILNPEVGFFCQSGNEFVLSWLLDIRDKH